MAWVHGASCEQYAALLAIGRRRQLVERPEWLGIVHTSVAARPLLLATDVLVLHGISAAAAAGPRAYCEWTDSVVTVHVLCPL